ncbi:DUF1819 family protein [Candidatus Saccharibacteria bacterium]|nr:DUF1819 family protein [Candidatus Saccharibacteria bacterium]
MTKVNEASNYTTSLTGEPFLFNETRQMAGLLASGEDINSLKKRNLAENLIMHKKSGSLKRVTTPIFRRLSVMSPTAVKLLSTEDLESAKLILLVSIAKTDRLVGDFLNDVYAEKIALKASKITKSDIERYFESIYQEEPFLRDRTEQTKAKLKQQLMKIISEAGLVKKIGSDFEVTRPSLTNKLSNQLIADGDARYIKMLGGSS